MEQQPAGRPVREEVGEEGVAGVDTETLPQRDVAHARDDAEDEERDRVVAHALAVHERVEASGEPGCESHVTLPWLDRREPG